MLHGFDKPYCFMEKMARRTGPGGIRTLAVRFENLPKKIRRGPRDVNITNAHPGWELVLRPYKEFAFCHLGRRLKFSGRPPKIA